MQIKVRLKSKVQKMFITAMTVDLNPAVCRLDNILYVTERAVNYVV